MKQITKQQVEQKAQEIQERVKNIPEMKEWIKIPANRQREIFGAAIFGRKDICISYRGEGIMTGRQAAFGTDYETQEYSYEEVAYMILHGLKADGRRYRLPTE